MESQQKIRFLDPLLSVQEVPAYESWTLLDMSEQAIKQTIILGAWSSLVLYSARTNSVLDLAIVHRGHGSVSDIRCAVHAHAGTKTEVIVKSVFEASDTRSETHILSLADTDGEVFLDSAMDIREWVTHAVWRLKERHIFLGTGGKIRGIPALVVHSDDIEASHALAIDRISDTELFYLRSRGFSEGEAAGIILEGAVSEIFSGLEDMDPESFHGAKTHILDIV